MRSGARKCFAVKCRLGWLSYRINYTEDLQVHNYFILVILDLQEKVIFCWTSYRVRETLTESRVSVPARQEDHIGQTPRWLVSSWAATGLYLTLCLHSALQLRSVTSHPVHRGKTEPGPMVSCPNSVSTVFNINQWDKKILSVWEISDKGFMVNQHSKRVTTLEFELQPHLALKQEFFLNSIFYLKISGPIIFKLAPQ